jgi:hypothetical protein
MLRKMYLVSSDYLNNNNDKQPLPREAKMRRKLPLPKKRNNKKLVKKKKPQHLYNEWVKLCNKIREADVERKTDKTIADF